jgi:4,5-DOPA dioxygenase extradiol
MKNNFNILFLSHGGGPMPILGDKGHDEMVLCLRRIASKIGKPSAILVVSAHWEETIPTMTSGSQPSLIYDYYGFPEESYNIAYPVRGEPALAKEVHNLLESSNIDAKLDEGRGFDHGLFVPLKIMYPEAAVPCIQLSLVNSLDPRRHINIGQALQSLDYDNLLMIGSGFSFHNMKAFFVPETSESKMQNEAFENWLLDTCSNPEMDEEERTQRLVNWEKAPFARYCHPREEHLLPLLMCYGFAGTCCSDCFELRILNKKTSMYLWEKKC